VNFRYGGSAIDDHKQMRQLNSQSDNTIVFTSHIDGLEQASASSNFSSQRMPLGPSNVQLNTPVFQSTTVEKLLKEENLYLSPYPSAPGESPLPCASISSPQITSSVTGAQSTPSRQVQVKLQNAEASSSKTGFARRGIYFPNLPYLRSASYEPP
jgi:hypothetical protein